MPSLLACDTGEIRLEGGTTPYNGRVEVCQNQLWGGVCDSGWTSVDATVVCRHLGYSGFSMSTLTQLLSFLPIVCSPFVQMLRPSPMHSLEWEHQPSI